MKFKPRHGDEDQRLRLFRRYAGHAGHSPAFSSSQVIAGKMVVAGEGGARRWRISPAGRNGGDELEHILPHIWSIKNILNDYLFVLLT